MIHNQKAKGRSATWGEDPIETTAALCDPGASIYRVLPVIVVIIKKILTRRPPLHLAEGQVWRMAEAMLRVTMVGKLLVHYKLGRPGAIRVSHSINSIATIEKYLRTHKAVLV